MHNSSVLSTSDYTFLGSHLAGLVRHLRLALDDPGPFDDRSLLGLGLSATRLVAGGKQRTVFEAVGFVGSILKLHKKHDHECYLLSSLGFLLMLPCVV